MTQQRLQRAVQRAFVTEVSAFKPGNVSLYSGGHGMHARDFLRSAEVATPALCRLDLGLGERVYHAVDATMDAVGCNTNLGMVLLFAPLVAAAAAPVRGLRGLRVALAGVLAGFTAADARAVFAAIVRANPGGLGGSDRYDLRRAPGQSLAAAMHHARHRDLVALQYASVYADVFSLGIPCLCRYRRRWGSLPWAVVACYSAHLAAKADSHVARKHGETTAQKLRAKATAVWQELNGCESPLEGLFLLSRLDRELKKEGINPGSCADLAAADLLACLLAAPAAAG